MLNKLTKTIKSKYINNDLTLITPFCNDKNSNDEYLNSYCLERTVTEEEKDRWALSAMYRPPHSILLTHRQLKDLKEILDRLLIDLNNKE